MTCPAPAVVVGRAAPGGPVTARPARGAVPSPAGTAATTGESRPGAPGAGPVPSVVLAAHGTRDPAGAPAVLAIAAAVRERLSTRVEVGWLSTGEPTFAELVARARPDVVVPLLLGTGHHVLVDIPRIVAGTAGDRPDATGRSATIDVPAATDLPAGLLGASRPTVPVVTPHLGPAREIVIALAERVRTVDPEPVAVVLAAAGTSHPVGRSETRQAADLLSQFLGVPVRVAYASGAGPDVTEAVRTLQASGARRVSVLPYVLAPGVFAKRIRTAAESVGAVTAGVLAAHPGVVDLVVRRVCAAAAAIPRSPQARAA